MRWLRRLFPRKRVREMVLADLYQPVQVKLYKRGNFVMALHLNPGFLQRGMVVNVPVMQPLRVTSQSTPVDYLLPSALVDRYRAFGDPWVTRIFVAE